MALSRTITFAPFFLAGYYSSEEKLKRFRKFTRFNILNKVPSILILIIGVLIALIFVNYSNIADEFFWADRSYSNFNIEIFTRNLTLYCSLYNWICFCICLYKLNARKTNIPIKNR